MTNPTNTVKTAAELREELRVAEAREAEIAEEARRAEAKAAEEARRVEAEKKRVARLATIKKVLTPIVERTLAVLEEEKLSAPVTFSWDHGKFKLGESLVPYSNLFMEDEYVKVGSFGTRPTGRMLVVVGDIGGADFRVRRFPLRNDGTYNVDKIVAALVERVAYEAARRDRETKHVDAKKVAQELAARVRREVGIVSQVITSTIVTHYTDHRGVFRSSESVAPKGKVYVNIPWLECTPEEAKILATAYAAVMAKRLDSKKES